MRIFVFAALAAATSVFNAPALSAKTSAKPTVLEPGSTWNVDFAPEKCRLARLFGEDGDRHLLFFEQYWPSESFGMTASGSAFDRFESHRRQSRSSRSGPQRRNTYISFLPEQELIPSQPFIGSVAGFGPALIYSRLHPEEGTDSEDEEYTSLPQLDPALGDKVRSITLEQRGKTVTYRTGPLGQAFKVLNQCTQSLIADWGLDPRKHVNARQLPRWENKRAITRRIQSNYPGRALLSGEQGIMRMRVIVDEKGMVEKCSIVSATETDSLESPACKAMQNAEFSPALDAQGNAFKSYFATSIIYRMGGR